MRDGSDNYSVPAGTDGEPNTTIESARYNAFVHDVEADLNLPRPIVAGGTAASNADDALINLQAEKATQVVDNLDTYPYMSGSFYAPSTATGLPVAGHAMQGFVSLNDDAGGDNMFLLAWEHNWTGDTRFPQSSPLWARVKVAGVWQAWKFMDKVSRSGEDMMTGPLYIGPPTATSTLSGLHLRTVVPTSPGSATQSVIFGGRRTTAPSDINMWTVQMPASDGNYQITRFPDPLPGTGVQCWSINRNTGAVSGPFEAVDDDDFVNLKTARREIRQHLEEAAVGQEARIALLMRTIEELTERVALLERRL